MQVKKRLRFAFPVTRPSPANWLCFFNSLLTAEATENTENGLLVSNVPSHPAKLGLFFHFHILPFSSSIPLRTAAPTMSLRGPQGRGNLWCSEQNRLPAPQIGFVFSTPFVSELGFSASSFRAKPGRLALFFQLSHGATKSDFNIGRSLLDIRYSKAFRFPIP
jgi:hypothetical protein